RRKPFSPLTPVFVSRTHTLNSKTRSDLQRHAGDVLALEAFAGGFGLVAIKPGETRAVVSLRALYGAFDVRLGLLQNPRDLALGVVELLFGFAFVLIGAGLAGPSAPGGVVGRDFIGCGRRHRRLLGR